MEWNKLQDLRPSAFKRLTGVRPSTFKVMVREVKQKTKKKGQKKKRGAPFKLSTEDQVLMTLMYWREYRTMYHIGHAYGISEAAVCRTINRVENILSKSDKFKLPGKKEVSKTKWSYEVFVVDATENRIERPKKNSTGTIPEKRKGIR
jgi:predicted DNA-binding protein YlxM (UPF0122 family)